ncbi:MAG TPA: porin family protein [Cyclobacteriaceae bacterium]|nr:porin family protein [Cyclobacteriaceae bacterium]
MLGRLLFFFTIAVLAGSIITYGQIDDCEIKLNQATEELNAGHFHGIDSLLTPCLKNGFSREQRQRAYLLLTQVYLLLDNSESAKESYLQLLRANPEFKTDESRDPIDVVYLSKKFTASPIFSLFARAGGNTSIISVIKSISITGEPISTKYSLKAGWTVAVGGDWNFHPNISLSSELQYSFTTYRREQKNLWSTSITLLDERQTWLNVPLLVKYSFTPEKKIVPYVYGGFALGFLFKSSANPTLIDRESSDDESETPSRSPNVNYGFKRNSINESVVLGGGARYKWGLHYLFVDLRYSFGLTNLLKYSGSVYDYTLGGGTDSYLDNATAPLQSSGTPVMRQASTDDFFKMDNLYFTIGYQHQLYNPRELKKARTRSVFKKIKRTE